MFDDLFGDYHDEIDETTPGHCCRCGCAIDNPHERAEGFCYSCLMLVMDLLPSELNAYLNMRHPQFPPLTRLRTT